MALWCYQISAEKDIDTDMVDTLGDEAPALSTVQKWETEFKRGRESFEDDPRSGCPTTATTQENIDHMVMDDRHLTVNQMANTVAISLEQVENILHRELGMSKVSARVLCLLMPDQKHTRLVMPQENLALFEAGPASFFERFLPQDECWVHHFDPEIKQQSMQWKHPSPPPSVKAKVVPLAGKVMPPSSGIQRALCSLITIRKDKPSTKSTTPTS